MTSEAKALVRAAIALAIAIGLVLAGIAIGANLWPHVIKVERHVIASTPLSRAGVLERLPDLVQGACGSIAAVKLPPAPKSHKRRSTTAPSHAAFAITPDGLLLTPAKGLPDTGVITVVLADGRELPAERVRTDDLTGLTLLKVDADDLPTLGFAEQGFPAVGDMAVGVSSPKGSGCAARFGFVSVDFLAEAAHEAAYVRLDPGADTLPPGTPLIGTSGDVIGISGAFADDAGAVLPAQVAVRVATLLQRGISSPEEESGVLADDLSPQLSARLGGEGQRGAVLLVVDPDSVAGKSGLQAGDVVLSAAGAPISSASELGRALDGASGPVLLHVQRRQQVLKVQLGS